MKIAVYPGSFDPLTLGHLDIIKRSAKLVDELVVAVLINKGKKPLFSIDERVNMIKDACSGIENVRVDSFEGLLVDYADKINADFVIRGLRNATDFDYESQIAQVNHAVNPKVDTIFLTTALEYAYLSSTVVKEVASYGGDISKFVPEQFIEPIIERINK